MTQRPNILFVTTHDSGRHFGCYGVPSVRTPAIDQFAAEGVRFDRMFAACSICSPSRGSMMTGQWPANNGLMHLVGMGGYRLCEPRRHLSHVLQRARYRTAMFGHQHEVGDPEALGFDELHHQEELPNAEGTARSVCAFLHRQDGNGQPFYAQVGFHETHTPYDFRGNPPDDVASLWLPPWTSIETPDDRMRAHVAGLQGSIRVVDKAVGMMLDALRDAGLERDTIVIMTTDHGPELPRGKWSQYDGGLGVAFIVRWPGGGIDGGRTCDALLSNVDVAPTLAELLAIRLPCRADGRSFAAAARGEASCDDDRAVFAEFYASQNVSVRTAGHKFIRNFWGSYFDPPPEEKRHRNPSIELFDLENDPCETRNLAYEPAHAATARAMSDRLWRWMETIEHPLLEGPYRVAGQPAPEPNERWRQAMSECPASWW